MTEIVAPRPRTRRQGGFTLIEVLAALAILGLSLSAIYQAFIGGMRNEASGRRHAAATMLAESRLAQVAAEYPVQIGHWSGQTPDGYQWSLRMRPAEDEALVSESRPLHLIEVEVRVTWQHQERQREVRLTSLRLAAVQ
jgi:general secretion pathway protein I